MYTLPSFLCKPILHPDRCTVCFVFIIKKSNNLAVYLHVVRVWPNVYSNADFKYVQVLRLSVVLASGISFTAAKATGDMEKKKKKEKKRGGGRVQCVMPTFFGRGVEVEAEICLLIPCEMYLDTIYVNWFKQWKSWVKFQNQRTT